MQDAFERELPAFDEALHQNRVIRPLVRRPFGSHFGRREERAQPIERFDKRRGIVGAHDTAARGQHQRLDHARILDHARKRGWVGSG